METKAAVIAGTFALALLSTAAQADSVTACKALETTDFSSIQDAPTQVMAANLVSVVGDVPAHCHVQGYIAPQVGFELKLPASGWNGKFIEIGCGGLCGSTQARELVAWCKDALRRGYACIVSDRGHTSSTTGAGSGDGLWAFNNLQAKIDYGFRAGHVAALSGKAITQHHYSAAPKFSYFMGCSGGGRQALMEAQRFPWDFDGIISMDAGPNLWAIHATLLWNSLAMTDQDGKSLFTPADIDLLHSAVLSQCDLDDGVKDGVIGYPPACKVDPVELLCKSGKTSGCLSSAQVAAARKIYSGPTTAKGEKLYYGAMHGSEKGSIFSGAAYSTEFFRYLAFMPEAGPRWNAKDFDFDFDTDFRRAGVMATFYDANNPDLRNFKAAGGKLMIVHGWHDSGSPMPLDTVDYYETVERTMGGRTSTQDFVRLFMMPGRAHCGGGPGANAFDYLGYLEAWVERGRAPDVMIGAHVESDDPADFIREPRDRGTLKFTRPLYPYPLQARYSGKGDPNDHRNFEPVKPVSQ